MYAWNGSLLCLIITGQPYSITACFGPSSSVTGRGVGDGTATGGVGIGIESENVMVLPE
jgi:hypothetical protein